jgi:hypothetical protein
MHSQRTLLLLLLLLLLVLHCRISDFRAVNLCSCTVTSVCYAYVDHCLLFFHWLSLLFLLLLLLLQGQ